MGIVASMYAFFFVSWIYLECITAATNITGGQPLGDAEILVASNGIFQVGFFSPSNSTNRYIGVWYNKKDSDGLDVVWVANRENPVNDHSGVLKLSEGGSLQVLNGQNKILWSSNVSSETNDTVAELHDSGNLVLRSIASGTIIWQSFEHPTDSLLPKVKLTLNQSTSPVLQSWKSLSDPSSGRFTLGINPDRQLAEMFIWDGDKPYWRSGPWNGNLFLGVAYMHSEVVNGFRLINNPDGTYQFSYSVANQSLLERLVLHYDGRLFQEDWNDGSKSWEVIWQSLQSDCDIYSKCGPFGSCNPKSSPICSCLGGFVPKNSEEWSKGNWSGGCVRRTPLQCGTTAGKRDGFWKRKHMKVPDNAQWVSANQDNCKRKCLENCSCLAYAYYSGIGCMFWNESLIDIQQFFDDGADLFIRLSHSELGKSTIKWKIIISVMAIMGTAMLVVFIYYVWRWRAQQYGKKVKNKETKSHNYIFNAGAAQVDFQELPLFDFEKLVVVTNDFSPKNKLGQGGFGPVYKGKLEDGREIAVKRLSKASGQGLQEFVNEVVVISKLQHRNLVRLLGCCVEGDEKNLVYEYMPNKSLDSLLFDPLHRGFLDWKKRFNIIKGICRGLLYLHRDSRLRIIHRDLKASNVLLDEELNPKISDFGMARIFGGKQDQANTVRVVGTYGYMSPEYAMEGRFSEKSDVFSFGVLLMEIVSGRKNSRFQDDESLNLLAHAWKLWNAKDILTLVDPTISDPAFQGEVFRCILVGLLCVQEFPEDRPNVSNIILMLDTSELIDVPLPNQPGFTRRKNGSTHGVAQNSQEYCSVNHVSLSVMSGR